MYLQHVCVLRIPSMLCCITYAFFIRPPKQKRKAAKCCRVLRTRCGRVWLRWQPFLKKTTNLLPSAPRRKGSPLLKETLHYSPFFVNNSIQIVCVCARARACVCVRRSVEGRKAMGDWLKDKKTRQINWLRDKLVPWKAIKERSKEMLKECADLNGRLVTPLFP